GRPLLRRLGDRGSLGEGGLPVGDHETRDVASRRTQVAIGGTRLGSVAVLDATVTLRGYRRRTAAAVLRVRISEHTSDDARPGAERRGESGFRSTFSPARTPRLTPRGAPLRCPPRPGRRPRRGPTRPRRRSASG